jgi:hypothetical protein
VIALILAAGVYLCFEITSEYTGRRYPNQSAVTIVAGLAGAAIWIWLFFYLFE